MKRGGIVYAIIHQRIKDKAYPDDCIWRKELFTILGRIYHIPRKQWHPVLKELIELEKVKFLKRDFLQIL